MPHATTPAVVRHPEHGLPVALDPREDYPDDDPLVRAYPWAFAAPPPATGSVAIEQATRAPGQRSRARRRP